jgi:hypothetical protein
MPFMLMVNMTWSGSVEAGHHYAVHAYGGNVFHDVTNIHHAKRQLMQETFFMMLIIFIMRKRQLMQV